MSELCRNCGHDYRAHPTRNDKFPCLACGQDCQNQCYWYDTGVLLENLARDTAEEFCCCTWPLPHTLYLDPTKIICHVHGVLNKENNARSR